MYTFVIIDGFKYAIQTGTYIRKWMRSFTSELAANIIRINYVDRGPGLHVYSMTLLLNTWDSDSLPYQAGITQTALQQIANLETSYKKIATAIQFLDPFGNAPYLNTGVFFTDLQQIIPPHATNQKIYIQAQIELTEAAGITLT